MIRLFNSEEDNFLRKNVQGRLATELTEMFNKKFNRNVTVKQIQEYKKTRKLRGGLKVEYTKEEKEYFYKIYKGKSTLEITRLLNEKFNKNFTRNNIRKFINYYKLKTGYVEHFPDMERKKERSYKKNGRTVYRVRNEDNEWEMKAKYLYRKNIGEVPSDCCVMLLDGSDDNFNLDNLCLISKRVSAFIYTKKLYFNDKEMNKASITALELMFKCNDLKKEVE